MVYICRPLGISDSVCVSLTPCGVHVPVVIKLPSVSIYAERVGLLRGPLSEHRGEGQLLNGLCTPA